MNAFAREYFDWVSRISLLRDGADASELAVVVFGTIEALGDGLELLENEKKLKGFLDEDEV